MTKLKNVEWEISKEEDFKEGYYGGVQRRVVSIQFLCSLEFLKPKTKYYWRVTYGNCVAISTFETAKMDEPWKADWISYRRNKRLCNLFKNISFTKEIKQARPYAVGHGLYEVFLMEKK